MIELFAQAIPVCFMTVYRDTLSEPTDFNYEYREGIMNFYLKQMYKLNIKIKNDLKLEILKINIEKQRDQQVGIKLGNKK